MDQSNKCTLIVDGNWLLMRQLFAPKCYILAENDKETNEKYAQQLKESMARCVSATLYRLEGIVDNILFVYDTGTWRKQVDPNYKGNRSHSDTIDWKIVWDAANSFANNLKELQITCAQVPSLEGDDLIYYWSRKLNAQGINCIIWSVDRDLQQLVCNNSTSITAWYNDKKGVYLHESLDNKMDAIEFQLCLEAANNPIVDKLKGKFACTYINPDEIAIEKIVCGDSGDNISPAVQITKSGKVFGITPKAWNNINEGLQLSTMQQFLKNTKEVAHAIGETKKCSEDEVYANIDKNIRLVWLDKAVIPNDILKKANKIPYYVYDISTIQNNYLVLAGDKEEQQAMDAFNEIECPF